MRGRPQGRGAASHRGAEAALPELVVITDVCLCAYTTHGHCGPVDEQGRIVNDATLGVLAEAGALAHAEAGADLVAPSDMIDGRVGAIRQESVTARAIRK